MNISVICIGTRGDIQPYIALAIGLNEAGHQTTLIAPLDHESLIRAFGINYSKINIDISKFLEGENWQRALASNSRTIKELSSFFNANRFLIQQDIYNATQESEAIVTTEFGRAYAVCISESRNIPCIVALTYPSGPPSNYFANIFFFPKPLPWKWANRLSHHIFEYLSWSSSKVKYKELREKLNLGGANESIFKYLRRKKIEKLHIYSESLFKRPSDWSNENTMTGFLVLSRKDRSKLKFEQPSQQLVEFLNNKPAPVFVGFGSMPILDGKALLKIILDATHEAGIRVIISGSWKNMNNSDLPQHAFFVKSVDHEFIFQKCAAICHHGGAGTTSAGLFAGKPAIICSFFGDQPFWGERVKALGVGTYFPFEKISKNIFLSALKYVQNNAVIEKAEAIGIQMRNEKGVGNAVNKIQEHLIKKCKLRT